MIKRLFNPISNEMPQVAEIMDHSLLIEIVGFQRNQDPTVVAVKVSAFSLVIQKTMSVTEGEFPGYGEHFRKTALTTGGGRKLRKTASSETDEMSLIKELET